mmetsp:Transcript_70350/g.183185  ORF Transcript_70350/g.183185 Transcript_70350/m.183185 type:complete len:237 (+) Transcript_70350:1263-1973(+)
MAAERAGVGKRRMEATLMGAAFSVHGAGGNACGGSGDNLVVASEAGAASAAGGAGGGAAVGSGRTPRFVMSVKAGRCWAACTALAASLAARAAAIIAIGGPTPGCAPQAPNFLVSADEFGAGAVHGGPAASPRPAVRNCTGCSFCAGCTTAGVGCGGSAGSATKEATSVAVVEADDVEDEVDVGTASSQGLWWPSFFLSPEPGKFMSSTLAVAQPPTPIELFATSASVTLWDAIPW